MKMMGFGIVLSLGWFLFESCDCDQTKEQESRAFGSLALPISRH